MWFKLAVFARLPFLLGQHSPLLLDRKSGYLPPQSPTLTVPLHKMNLTCFLYHINSPNESNPFSATFIVSLVLEWNCYNPPDKYKILANGSTRWPMLEQTDLSRRFHEFPWDETYLIIRDICGVIAG